MNILVDDAAPEISYYSTSSSVGWIVNHSSDQTYPDDFVVNYSQSTFHGTFGAGDKMQYRFNGSAVAVYGAKRVNHGTFGVKVDDTSEVLIDGYSATSQYQQRLYYSTGLNTSIEHEITVTNYPNKSTSAASGIDHWLDIDHIVVTQPTSGVLYTTYIDDAASAVSYDSDWATSTGTTDSTYFNSTNHVTYTTNSAMVLTFTGSSVQLYGGINTDHGNYSVSLDGATAKTYNGTYWELLHFVPLFTASGLDEVEHTVEIINLGSGTTDCVGYDYAVVNSTVDPDVDTSSTIGGTSQTTTSISSIAAVTVTEYGSSTASQTSNSTDTASSVGSSSTSNKSNIAAISGGVAGGVVAFALLSVIVLWYLRRRRQQKPQEAQVRSYYSSHPPGSENNPTGRLDLAAGAGAGVGGARIEPSPAWTDGPVTPYLSRGYSPALEAQSRSSMSTNAQSPMPTPREDSPFLSQVPPPPASTASSYPFSVYAPSALPSSYAPSSGSLAPMATHAASAPHTDRSTELPYLSARQPPPPASQPVTHSINSVMSKSGKSQLVYPYSGPTLPRLGSLEALSETSWHRVENRESASGTDGHGRDVLPPDYVQATQPLPGQRPRSAASSARS